MEQFKQASKLKLRFATDKGLLSTEQLWDLNQTQLANLIKSIKKVLKQTDNDDDLSFLTTTSSVADTENKLRFDIAKEIYLTKKKEIEELRDAAQIKQENEKILSIIARKKESKLEEMSVEELEKLIK
jgi:hypothetical protein